MEYHDKLPLYWFSILSGLITANIDWSNISLNDSLPLCSRDNMQYTGMSTATVIGFKTSVVTCQSKPRIFLKCTF